MEDGAYIRGKLDEILVQTTKTNGTVGQLKIDVADLKKVDEGLLKDVGELKVQKRVADGTKRTIKKIIVGIVAAAPAIYSFVHWLSEHVKF